MIGFHGLVGSGGRLLEYQEVVGRGREGGNLGGSIVACVPKHDPTEINNWSIL